VHLQTEYIKTIYEDHDHCGGGNQITSSHPKFNPPYNYT